MPNTKKRIPQLTGGAQPDTSFCSVCLNKAERKDVLGFFWCEGHRCKGVLIDWLDMHGWPLLDSYPSIAPDKQSAVLQVIQGSDEYIWHVIAYIEAMESEQRSESRDCELA